MLYPCVNSLINKRKYFQIGCKNIESLFLLIDRLNIVSLHGIIEILVPMNIFKI